MAVKVSNAYPKDVEAPASGVDDMTRLAYLHEPGVLENMKSRFDINEIYVSSLFEISSVHLETQYSLSLWANVYTLFQTYTGNILIAVNPFRRLPHLYSSHMMQQYKGAALGELSPHPFAVADAAYRCPAIIILEFIFFPFCYWLFPVWLTSACFPLGIRQMKNQGISQSILVSGESGAGKTETTKLLMQYLADMGGRAVSEGRSVEKKVLEVIYGTIF